MLKNVKYPDDISGGHAVIIPSLDVGSLFSVFLLFHPHTRSNLRTFCHAVGHGAVLH